MIQFTSNCFRSDSWKHKFRNVYAQFLIYNEIERILKKQIANCAYCTRDFIQMKHEQYGLSNPNIMVSPYLRKEG